MDDKIMQDAKDVLSKMPPAVITDTLSELIDNSCEEDADIWRTALQIFTGEVYPVDRNNTELHKGDLVKVRNSTGEIFNGEYLVTDFSYENGVYMIKTTFNNEFIYPTLIEKSL